MLGGLPRPEHKRQHIANPAMPLQRMPKRQSQIEAVAIPTSFPLAAQGTGRLQFGHDPLDRTFRDAHLRRNITKGLFRVGGKTDEDMRVIAEEGPARSLG